MRTITKKIAVHPDNPDAYVVSVSVNFASKEFPYGWAQIFPANILVKDAKVMQFQLMKGK
jgi:hypothetical protein